jgi:hypothetical protein
MRGIIALALAPMILVGCQQAPRGKDYLRQHPDELRELIRTCADGTHANSQECSNAESLRALNNKLQSLAK